MALPGGASPSLLPGKHMERFRIVFKLAMLLLVIAAAPRLWAQGPPYQTDDPVPVDSAITSSTSSARRTARPSKWIRRARPSSSTGAPFPASSFTPSCPGASISPLNHPAYAPAGAGPFSVRPHRHGAGRQDRLHQGEPAHSPDRHLHHVRDAHRQLRQRPGHRQGLVQSCPSGCRRTSGKWLFDGGGGYERCPADRITATFPTPAGWSRGSSASGWSLERRSSPTAAKASAAPQDQSSAMIDIGGYYHFKHNPNEQFLFCYGHSVAGQTENYAYVGMYWTWGKDARAAPTTKNSQQNDHALFPSQRQRMRRGFASA